MLKELKTISKIALMLEIMDLKEEQLPSVSNSEMLQLNWTNALINLEEILELTSIKEITMLLLDKDLQTMLETLEPDKDL